MVLEKSVNRSPRHQKFYSDSQKVHKGLIIERENSDVRRVCFLACISWDPWQNCFMQISVIIFVQVWKPQFFNISETFRVKKSRAWVRLSKFCALIFVSLVFAWCSGGHFGAPTSTDPLGKECLFEKKKTFSFASVKKSKKHSQSVWKSENTLFVRNNVEISLSEEGWSKY